MNRNLLILGAGQYGAVAKETAQAMGCFDQIAFLDDQNQCAVGTLAEYERFCADYRYAFVAMGDAKLRLGLIQKLEEACFTIALLVHPKAAVAPSAQIFKGTIVEGMAVVNSNATVAIGCILCAGAVVNHNCFVGDGCHIDCNGVVTGCTVVPAETKVACGRVYEKGMASFVKRCPDDYTFEVGM